jgi:hypothetical protein
LIVTDIAVWLGLGLSILAIILTIVLELLNKRVTNSQNEYKKTRDFISASQIDLIKPAFEYYKKNDEAFYPIECMIGDTVVTVEILTEKGWIPDNPLLLGNVHTKPNGIAEKEESAILDFQEVIKNAQYLWPYKTRLGKFSAYHEVMEQIDKPELFENRDTFIVEKIEPSPSYTLTFRMGKYFKHLDIGEALTYELAKAISKEGSKRIDEINIDDRKIKRLLKFRKLVGNPANFANRCSAAGINTLTIFHADSEPKFIMHHRGAGKVALERNMFNVVPAGEFQPAVSSGVVRGSELWVRITNRDFEMWRNVIRECDEELQGSSEILDSEDYSKYPPFNKLNDRREKGDVIPYYLGFALDPLSLKPEILMVCIYKGKSFEEIFDKLSLTNAEGTLFLGRNNVGIVFDEKHVREFLTDRPTLPAGKACLALAWKNRKALGITGLA